MITEDNIPSWLLGKSFVAFNFEVTGLDPEKSKIIAIGAVKIENGKITKKFSSFVNPKSRIPKEITKITGITNKDVKKAPTFDEVIADFYIFCYGSALIAQQIDFELNFLRYNTKDSVYIFSNKTYEAITLAKKFFALPVNKDNYPSNFKIETVAALMGVGYKNIKGLIDEAIMVAEVFLKIMSHENFSDIA